MTLIFATRAFRIPVGRRYAANDWLDEVNGDSWLIATSTVDDPTYFAQPFMTSTHFKREPDGSKWNPRPCEITLPPEGR